MKRKFLNIISCFLALFIFVGSFVFCFSSRVSAEISFSFPSSWFYSGVNESLCDSYLDDLKTNPNFSDFEDCYVLFNGVGSSSISVFIISPNSQFTWDNGVNRFFWIGKFSCFSCSVDLLDSYSFDVYNLDSVPAMPNISPNCLYCFPYNGSVGFGAGTCNLYNNSPVLGTYVEYNCFYHVDNSVPPYEDDYLTGFVTGFDYSTEAFVQWLIDTGKYQDLPAYIGTSKLVSFVDFYKQWGSSNKLFVVKIIEWMAHFNIGAQSLENRNFLKSTIDRLYQEYCNSSYVIFKSNSANNVHHRQNINTKTDDTDLTLVTDDPNDDTITSILRDILRGVIAIPTSIYNNSQAIISKLDSLNWTVNIVNDGGYSSGSDLTPVLNKMDDIIYKLEADTVSVEIDQITKDDTDDFFYDWNLEFSSALNNKFPVASQLRIFFTGFFERCGIDADSDGEVYQYYNPGVLTASSVSRSAGTASEADIVSDFLGKFDNSDPTFLDDASFQGVPDLSVSVGGHLVSIIDFRVYAKYRDKIHFIISFVIWTLYLLHLYKALPSIIGQVADVAVKTSDL